MKKEAEKSPESGAPSAGMFQAANDEDEGPKGARGLGVKTKPQKPGSRETLR